MDTYSFTTASARADWLENRKAEIQEQIDNARNIRSYMIEGTKSFDFWDKEIDKLIEEKENLRPPEVEAWTDEAEALARDAADFAATEQSALGKLY